VASAVWPLEGKQEGHEYKQNGGNGKEAASGEKCRLERNGERERARESPAERRREDQPAPLLTGQRAIQQLGGPLMALFFSGYTPFYALFRLPPHRAPRVSLSFPSASPRKRIFRANTFRAASEIVRRATALKAGDSV